MSRTPLVQAFEPTCRLVFRPLHRPLCRMSQSVLASTFAIVKASVLTGAVTSKSFSLSPSVVAFVSHRALASVSTSFYTITSPSVTPSALTTATSRVSARVSTSATSPTSPSVWPSALAFAYASVLARGVYKWLSFQVVKCHAMYFGLSL